MSLRYMMMYYMCWRNLIFTLPFKVVRAPAKIIMVHGAQRKERVASNGTGRPEGSDQKDDVKSLIR